MGEQKPKDLTRNAGPDQGSASPAKRVAGGSRAAPRARCLCIDIETARHDRLVLRELGAFRPDLDKRLRLSGKSPDLVQQLDRMTEGAAFVLGHNVIAFDQPGTTRDAIEAVVDDAPYPWRLVDTAGLRDTDDTCGGIM